MNHPASRRGREGWIVTRDTRRRIDLELGVTVDSTRQSRHVRREAMQPEVPNRGRPGGVASSSFLERDVGHERRTGADTEIEPGIRAAEILRREGDLYWIRCPKCRYGIDLAFSRFDAPRYHQHVRGQCNASLIVLACASTGTHRVDLLAHGDPTPRLQEYVRDRKAIHQHLAAVFVMTGEDDG